MLFSGSSGCDCRPGGDQTEQEVFKDLGACVVARQLHERRLTQRTDHWIWTQLYAQGLNFDLSCMPKVGLWTQFLDFELSCMSKVGLWTQLYAFVCLRLDFELSCMPKVGLWTQLYAFVCLRLDFISVVCLRLDFELSCMPMVGLNSVF